MGADCGSYIVTMYRTTKQHDRENEKELKRKGKK